MEKNPVGAARTEPSVCTPSWRVAIGSDAHGPRAAPAPAPLLRFACCSARLDWLDRLAQEEKEGRGCAMNQFLEFS
jgi:hypothetical protein